MFRALGYNANVTEEIVRWGFEIRVLRESPDRFIAFTNPTAGPWKLVRGKFKTETYEVHRFGKLDERPDVIIVCDQCASILILEAKGDIKALNSRSIKKTFALSRRFAPVFSTFDQHQSWLPRQRYRIVTGFIFGSVDLKRAEEDGERLLALIARCGFDRDSTYVCVGYPSDGSLEFREIGNRVRLLK